MEDGMPLLEFRDISYTYPGSKRPALRGLSLSIEEGEYVALVGRNGSGKSTLIRLLDGLRLPTAGEASILGLDPRDPANARALRSAVALVFQAPLDQIVSSVVEEDCAFGPENLGLPRAEIEGRVARALEAVGLGALRRRQSLFLSAGQQQRLAIAGALAMEPRCMAFDEATAMLDPQARAEVLDLMDSLNAKGMTIVHATHDMAEAARARRVVLLEEGRIVYDGAPAGLFLSRDGGEPPALSRGLGLPPAAMAALALGLEALPGERLPALAARIANAGRGKEASAPRAAVAPQATPAPPPGAKPPAASPCAAAAATGASPGQRTSFIVGDAGYSYLKGTANEVKALEGVSMSLAAGSMTALVGRTGSGKSTILQLLDGLAFPSAGCVLAFGEETAAKSTDLRRLRMKAPLAIQRPESALFEVYAGDDVAFGPRNQGLSGKALVERVKSAMEELGLPFEAYRDRGTRGLSGGEKRRLALAGILALEPEAFLLDEPTSALDPATRSSVLGLVRSLAEAGRTAVFATHSMEEAAMADSVAVVAEGRLAAFGSPAEIFYDRYDPAWGIGRPFACELALELRRLGLPLAPEARPLDLASLVAALGSPDGAVDGEGGRP